MVAVARGYRGSAPGIGDDCPAVVVPKEPCRLDLAGWIIGYYRAEEFCLIKGGGTLDERVDEGTFWRTEVFSGEVEAEVVVNQSRVLT